MWMKEIFYEEVKEGLKLFLVFYFLENFLINLLDLVLIKNVYSDYYHDDLFLSYFSFKAHQLVLTLLVAFMITQMQAPTVALVKKTPEVITLCY